jgi:hypothetical protein
LNDRHFLQENLPRIRYNNPTVEYEVYKTLDTSTKPTIAVHFCKFRKRSFGIRRQFIDLYYFVANGTSKVIEIPRVQSNVIVDQVFAATP